MINDFFNFMASPEAFPLPEKTLSTINQEGLKKIASERLAVENFLTTPECPAVYGFNTLFGHHDNHTLNKSSQVSLLNNHLVGNSITVPSSLVKTFFASRVLFFLNGSTGVPVSVFKDSLNILNPNYSGTVEMNVSSSYSCGDVVQGAWLFNHLLTSNKSVINDAGALMSFINGYFYSTSVAVVFSAWLVALLDKFVEFLDIIESRFSKTTVQLPVSLRDSRPLREHIVHVVSNLREAFLARLGSPSSNPLFTVKNHSVTNVDSGNGFLDFRLGSALNMAIELATIVGAFIQRMVYHYGELLNNSRPVDKHFVQPSKIALAEFLKTKTLSSPLRDFVGMESEGVEDIFDLTTLTAQKVGLVANSLTNQLKILETLFHQDPILEQENTVRETSFGSGFASTRFITIQHTPDLSLSNISQRGKQLLNLF